MLLALQPLKDDLYSAIIAETFRYIASGDLMKMWTANVDAKRRRRRPGQGGGTSAYNVFHTALSKVILKWKDVIAPHHPAIDLSMSVIDINRITTVLWDRVGKCGDLVDLCVRVAKERRSMLAAADELHC
ncbi:hypothetical protein EXIGLDRAFT_829874 [Exidia glandulosa HHB12029]|uniref:Uncharacterized protein n=1 Tax=Exidia glandulosa HHB12029 TaxID=1314781 RepID=A0A165P532_EXIGL|nr:hypothetical protein EXIGLDRAFT_829874 [Exidia glandulosa HHB12029]